MVVPPQRDGGQRQYVEAPLPEIDCESMQPVLNHITDNLDAPHTVPDLARLAMMSERTFARRFVAETGTTPHKWIVQQRVLRARELLESTDLPGRVGGVAQRLRVGGVAAHPLPDRRGHLAAALPPRVLAPLSRPRPRRPDRPAAAPIGSSACASRDTPLVRTPPTASSRGSRAASSSPQVQGDPLYQPIVLTGETVPLEDARLLAPVIPRSKVIGIGRNYADHAKEMGGEPPAQPLMFLVPNTAVVGPGDPIVMPAGAQEISYEGELAVIIGRIAKDVPARAGVTRSSTATPAPTTSPPATGSAATASGPAPRVSTPPRRSARGSAPTSTSPTCASRAGSTARPARTARTADMIFDVETLVSYVSAAFTLLPGDVILTGTPAGVGLVEAGQRVDVEIEGIGTLSNTFVRR